uniref:Translation initiation factor IF-2 n=1 Tax=Lygus hesperus TaxID=30085 RepID=A0A0A9WY60_LYGHE
MDTIRPIIPTVSREAVDVCTRVTMLDTPGHKSFFNTRENAAAFADAALLLVDSVEGVTQGTAECVEILTAFHIPYAIVLTKCDEPASQVETVLEDLIQTHRIQIASWDTAT